ncbi:MAG: protein phosphatase 2C domain-containing protein [Nocardioides sp.]|uniref:PP2C family protein-serine/threonine phosphatase n=1 Tax=Nocardioides sp. TaxID=35761 RepID=UPI0039E64FA4
MESTTDLTVATWSPPDPRTAATTLAAAGASHVGRVRKVNEDAHLVAPPVFVVADGMGGHALGDVASALVIESFTPLGGRGSATPAEVEGAIGRSRVTIAAIDADGQAEPGATMVSAAYVVESGRGYWLIAHVGDSRAYSWRDGELEQITHDHSLVQEMIDAGHLDAAQAAVHPERHVITRAIGPVGNAQADYSLVPLEAKQRILLCSDGLTSELSDRSIASILSNEESPEDAVSSLVEAAVNMGGRDNVTAIIIDVVDCAPPAPERDDTVPLGRVQA